MSKHKEAEPYDIEAYHVLKKAIKAIMKDEIASAKGRYDELIANGDYTSQGIFNRIYPGRRVLLRKSVDCLNKISDNLALSKPREKSSCTLMRPAVYDATIELLLEECPGIRQRGITLTSDGDFNWAKCIRIMPTAS